MEDQRGRVDRVRQLMGGQNGHPPDSAWEAQGGSGDGTRLDAGWPQAQQATFANTLQRNTSNKYLMEYNWSWLPARTATTPPPLGPRPDDLRDNNVYEDLDGINDRARLVQFMRYFPHDNTENEGANELQTADFDEETTGDDDTEGDIGNDDIVDEHEGDVTGDDNGDEATDEVEEEGPPFDPVSIGLKEISNLASFTVSSYKPGCGVAELRDDDVHLFWQSDGPQPHRLNIHFVKRVEIRALRLYLDYEMDESYTPTKLQVTAGFGPNLTIPFTTMELNMPKGWIDVPIAGAGGGPDGNSLCCWFLRVIILENHQNGKDTHLRGVKVYALDDNADTAENNPVEDMVEAINDYEDRLKRMNIREFDEGALLKHEAEMQRKKTASKKFAPGDGGLGIPDFMREPEIR